MKKKKLKIVGVKKGTKVGITLILAIVGIVIYHFLSAYGSYAVENNLGSIFICLGWFWLIVGEFGIIYTMWEK